MRSLPDLMEVLAVHNTKLRQRVIMLEAENAELHAELAIRQTKETNEIFEIQQMYERS